MRVSSDMPDDVIVLHDALQKIRDTFGTPEHRISPPWREGLEVGLKNSGTALRFLQVHLDKCYPGEPITLTGDERLMERDGKPTSQTTSARILHGEDIPVEPGESPYITMSRRLLSMYQPSMADSIELDWSSAAFWYEYVAIHGGELVLEGLQKSELQGDNEVAQLYSRYFGVLTSYQPQGVKIFQSTVPVKKQPVTIDFERIPDLYPAVALTCERLGIPLQATGTSRLRFKESNRLTAVRLHEVRNDHRMAMSLMCADFPVSIEEQACIVKSYPAFVPQHIVPRKGINDDNMGKKHALSKLIRAAVSEYVWLHDDDVIVPPAASVVPSVLYGEPYAKADLIILPLRMESEHTKPSLLERLQIAEYAAIQQLTVESAQQGRAVMCSGANLIVRRRVWLECEPSLHPEIPSGDDMFLLEAAKRGGYRISVLDDPGYTAIVRPVTTWRAFFRQRMRWAGKAPRYTDPDIRRCGMYIVAANVLQIICPLVLLVKFPIEYRLVTRREPSVKWDDALLLELLYPWYILVCLVGGLFRQQRW